MAKSTCGPAQTLLIEDALKKLALEEQKADEAQPEDPDWAEQEDELARQLEELMEAADDRVEIEDDAPLSTILGAYHQHVHGPITVDSEQTFDCRNISVRHTQVRKPKN